MSENVAEYYPNALCFDDLSKLSFLGNWFDSKYNNIFIAIEACKNTDENPNKCASFEEIKEFVKHNQFYVIS